MKKVCLEVDNKNLDFLAYKWQQQDEEKKIVEILGAQVPQEIVIKTEFDIKNQ